MGKIELRERGRFVFREAVPAGEETADPVLLVHGFPESSLMWVPLMRKLAARGRRSIAPDLYGLGSSTDDGPATFERNLEALGALHEELGLGRVSVVVHDWGGFVGLAWAAQNASQVEALVISGAGFFADGNWHGMAQILRGEHGEEVIGAIDRDSFAGLLRADGADFSEATIDAYWRPFAVGRGRRVTLEFYRSMDFSKLEPYQSKLAELGVPTLLVWGAADQFAPLAGGQRFEREIPGARLVSLGSAGHFVFDQEPDRTTREVVEFLSAEPSSRSARSEPANPHLQAVWRAYRAFDRRDGEALRRLSHAEIEVHAVTGSLAGADQPYRGADGLADYMRDVERVWDEIKLTPQEFEPLDANRVLVTGRVRVRRDRSRVDTPSAWLWEFEGDRIRRVRVLTDAQEIDDLRANPPAK